MGAVPVFRNFRAPAALCALITLAAFAARLPGLASVPPRWDEGWSIAHASLPIGELLRITAADAHPPLYYLAVAAWRLAAGVNLFAIRDLGVLASLLCVPLAYQVAGRWAPGHRRLPLVAAAAMAWLPLAVYYSAVARMYAFAPAFVLLAAAGALRPERRGSGAMVVLGALGAMLTLYHAGWALAALCAYAVARAPVAQRRRLVAWTAFAAVLYLPWAIYALPQLAGRAIAEGATNVGQQYSLGYFVENGLIGLAMAQQTGWAGVIALGALVAAGALARPRQAGALALPGLAIAATLIGVAAAARNWALNARMLIGAAPFLALALAWALDALAGRWRAAAAVAAAALVGLFAPTSLGLVYAKTLEVFDPYNARTYAAHLAARGRGADLAFFNVLSPAGFYALERGPAMPEWSYALTWDPVIEPAALWQARIREAAAQRGRLWLVLYRGLAGRNGDLRGWMDSTYFPAFSEWGDEEVFYGLYGVAVDPLLPGGGAGEQWGNVALREARLPASAPAGAVIPVGLTWRSAGAAADAKVFVHALAADGRLLAQHDARPLNELRPFPTLPPGEDVADHHGLALPADYVGPVRVVLGLYDPATGQRLKSATGRDAVEVGIVTVRAP